MKRFVLNMMLLVLILVVMGFQFLPKMMHEVCGIILLLGIIYHLVLNYRWFTSFFRGNWNKLRILQTIISMLLIISFFTATVTGIIFSNQFFRELWIGVPLHRSVFIHQLHISSAYFMVITGGMHIGQHWSGFWQQFKKLPVLGNI